VAKARLRESWTTNQWQDWQQERLTQILFYAAKNVPYYRQHWEQRRQNGDKASPELLENWPVLSKDTIRNSPKAFVADGVNLRRKIAEHTSGTTGKPLTLWMSKSAIQQWYTLFEARWRGWYGLSRHDRWGILGGQLIAPFSQKQPPFWVWNAGLNQLYFSSYHLKPDNIPAYIKAFRDHRLVYLLGYASSLYTLSQTALELNLQLPALKAVISNAEPLYAHQRETISRAFNCPVYDTYGLSENVCAASECSFGNLHLWPEVGVTEILEDISDLPAPPGKVGRLICTGLLNKVMPLIRYEVGDRASLTDIKTTCACGRDMPVLDTIDGRMDDVVITPDGRRVGRLDPVFKIGLRVREAQVIQESLTQLRVKYVPAAGFNVQDENLLIGRLQERVGEMQIILEEVISIHRSANGKFRAVISMIDSNKKQ
jgi:phenylacetate-CoA ligase